MKYRRIYAMAVFWINQVTITTPSGCENMLIADEDVDNKSKKMDKCWHFSLFLCILYKKQGAVFYTKIKKAIEISYILCYT